MNTKYRRRHRPRYPHTRIRRKLVWLICSSGRYQICTETGSIKSTRTGKELYRYGDKKSGRKDYVRLRYRGQQIGVSIGRVVWIFTRKRLPPPGFDIHHRDTDPDNNHWRNLICIYDLDHQFLHEDLEDVPF